jgi:hypothetical protein
MATVYHNREALELEAKPVTQRPGRLGVAAVFTPKDFRLNAIMRQIVALVEEGSDAVRPRV